MFFLMFQMNPLWESACRETNMQQRWQTNYYVIAQHRLLRLGHLDVSVRYLVLVKVFETFQDLPCVEADGVLVVFQRAPLGPQQCGKTPWKSWKENNTHQSPDPTCDRHRTLCIFLFFRWITYRPNAFIYEAVLVMNLWLFRVRVKNEDK